MDPKASRRWLGGYLAGYLLFAALSGTLAVLYVVGERGRSDALLDSQQAGRLAMARETVAVHLRRVASDAEFLSGLAAEPAAGDPRALEARFAAFLEARSVYRRLVLLDRDGVVRLQARFDGERASVDSAARPASASDPETSVDCRGVTPGSAWISPLRVRGGGAERTGEPAFGLCFATPPTGGVDRIVLLDFDAQILLDRLGSGETGFVDQLWIADEYGAHLLGGTAAGGGVGAGSPAPDDAVPPVGDPELARAFGALQEGSLDVARGHVRFARVRTEESTARRRIASARLRVVTAEPWTLVSVIPRAWLAARERHVRTIAFGTWSGLQILALVTLALRLRLAKADAAQALRRRAQFRELQRIADALPIPVFVRRADGRILGTNRAGAELTGLSQEAVQGRLPHEVLQFEDESPMAAADAEFASGAQRARYELRLVKGRELRDVVVHRALLHDESGAVAGTVSSVADVTEFKQTQRRLAESEERFRTLIENSLDLIGILDREGRIEYVSPSIESILGWKPTEVIGRSIGDLVQPDDLRRLHEVMTDRLLRPGGSRRFLLRFRTRGGGHRHLESFANNLLDETLVRSIYLFSRDVTDAIEAQERVEEAKRLLESVIDELPVAFVAVDERRRPVRWNRELERIMGYRSDETEEVREALAALLPRAFELDGGPSRPAGSSEPSGAAPARAVDLPMRHKDGEARTVAWSRGSTRVPGFGWHGWAVGVDVTEQRSAERELKGSAEQLEALSHRLLVLNMMDDILLVCSTLDEAYAASLPYIRQLVRADAGVLYRLTGARDEGIAGCDWGRVEEAARRLEPQSCWGIKLGRAHRFGESTRELRCAHVPAGFEGRTLCVPMLSGGELQGLLHLRFAAATDADADVESLQQISASIAGHLSMRLAAIALREDLQHQSTRDPLTNLFNRRYMEETLLRELKRCQRTSKPLAVLAADLDRFKAINDRHGHDGGDAVLREVAAVLQRHSRASDVACRAGGEEFVLLLVDMGIENAIVRAEAVRLAILALGAEDAPAAFRGLSISIGVAAFPEHAQEPAALLRSADRALYRAKDHGRNRVEVASSPREPPTG